MILLNLNMTGVQDMNIVSYNCTGFVRSEPNIRDILSNSKVDILCLQETWLYDFQSHKMSSVSDQFLVHGVSGMDSSHDVLRGRPHGGVAILWHKSLVNKVNVIKCKSKCFCALSVDTGEGTRMIIVNVYLPCDNMSINVCDETFIDTLHGIEQLLSSESYDYVCLCGDWNCDLDRRTAHCNYLRNFAERNKLSFGWTHQKAEQDNTYCNYA